jgi:hypothetical protein
MQQGDILKTIIRYLNDHPDACDTLEGIVQWWMNEATMEFKAEEVSRAVAYLCSKGVLAERLIGGRKVYSVDNLRLLEL